MDYDHLYHIPHATDLHMVMTHFSKSIDQLFWGDEENKNIKLR